MKPKKKELDGPRDMISGLHDELICHILSFLPTKEAASTSVLAKRWKHLFAFVPNLDFDDSLYCHPPRTNQRRRENSESFLEFVDSVLALKEQVKAPLNRFHLKCQDVVDASWVSHWIENVLKRGVSDLDIYMSSPWPSLDSIFEILPSEMYVSKTLVRLKLRFRGSVCIELVDDVSLPNLKTLHLDCFQIEKSVFDKLLSGCHALEELVMVNLMLRWDSREPEPLHVTISIPTIKRLKFCRFELSSESVLLSFDTPKLVYFEYAATIADMYQKLRFESLVEARLKLRMSFHQTETDKINVKDLLMGIRNVKILYLSDETLEVLAHFPEIIPVFKNLIQLTIKTKPYVQWDALPTLLRKCPNLQTLVFKGLHHKYTNRCEVKDGCLCNMVVHTCLSSSPVKVLKILKFGETFDHDDDTEKQIEQVKHFLETMPSLEQVMLYYNTPIITNDQDVKKVFMKLLELPIVVASAK
ncbi:putative F-box/LRR-repeat protein [Cardamine amara subsp. amara]|uniref:F-box/LRR-repeat protein n=1 Tax=Cardamine amara subsp. amara TaxID=228776 RepID=A0ABD0ZA43_CARAN